MKILSCFLACSALAVRAEPNSRVVAVLEFQSKLEGAEKKAVDSGYLADTVRSAVLEAAPGLRVMTRENVLVLLNASGKKLEDCQGECEVDTGRLLGADLVISGELLKFGSSFKLTLKLHDTHDGRLISGTQASGRTVDELDVETAKAVRKLVQPLVPQGQRPAAESAPAGPPATGGSRLTFASDVNGKSYAISVESRGRTYPCGSIVSEGNVCELEGVPAGNATLVIEGDANERNSFLLSRENRSFRIERRGIWPIVTGLTLIGIGGAIALIGWPTTAFYGNTGVAVGIAAIAVGAPGIPFLLYGLARSPIEVVDARGVQVAMIPVPGGAAAGAAMRF
ncbi:MAG: DUF3280 domain-containing protein [Myxococcales bacterium]|nr:DUF3280 domain-containing protein [Myxococcales bacterium]